MEAGYAQAFPQAVPDFRRVRYLVIVALTIVLSPLVAGWLLTRDGTPHATNAVQDQIAQQPGNQTVDSKPSAAGSQAVASSGQPADNSGRPPLTGAAPSLPLPPVPENLADISKPNPWQQSVSMAWETPARIEPLHVLSGNGSWPSTIAFSPDGKLLACGTRTGTVLVWIVEDGRLLFRLDAHDHTVSAIAFSPDGNLLATAGFTALPADETRPSANNSGLRFWRLKDGMLDRQRLALPSQPIAMVFSSDSRDLAAACDDGTVTAWRVANRKLLHGLYPEVGRFSCAAFSPDAKLLASCAADTVRVWRAADGEIVFNHSSRFSVKRLAFNQRGTMLAIVCEDQIEAWPSGAGSSVRTYRVPRLSARNPRRGGARADQQMEEEGLSFAQFTPDGKLLVGANPTHLICWDGPSSRLVAMVPCVAVKALAISPDGSLVACAHEDGNVSIWQVTSNGRLALSSSHTAAITAVARSTDGALLATASNEGMVCVWQAANGEPRATIPALYEGGVPQALTFRNSSANLAVVRSQELTFCNLEDGNLTFQPRGSEQQQVVCSPDGGTLVMADKTMLSLWDGEPLAPRTYYSWAEGVISSIAVGPGGQVVALGLINGSEYSLKLRHLRASEEETFGLFTQPVSGLAFSGDGCRLACTASGGQIHVYDVLWGAALCTIDCRQDVRSLVFSPDGHTLACAAGSRVLLYGLPKADSLGSIDAHSAPVSTLIFAPDGSWLASGGEDGQVRVWRPAPTGVPTAR